VFRKGDFPLNITTYQGKTLHSYPFGLYYHPEWEFHLICRGNCQYFIRDMNYPCEKNSLLIIHPNEAHCYIRDETAYTKNIALVFKDMLVEDRVAAQAALRSLESVHHLVLSDKQAAALEYMLQRIADEHERKDCYWQNTVVNYIAAFLTILQRAADGCIMPGRENNDPVIQEVLRYLDKEFAEMPSLTDVASSFGLSAYTLSKKFKQYVGVGYLEYLIHLRIEEARRLLAKTDKSVTEIAYEVGFESISTFFRDFRLLTKVTPATYRKMSAGSTPIH
jgi:AraC-like DNA-binding protein